MKKHIAVTVITVAIAGAVFAQEQSAFVTQEIGLMPTVGDKISSLSEGHSGRGDFVSLSAGGTPTLDWAAYFRAMGMKWPDGSSVRMDPLSGKLIVTNTPENLELLSRILGTMGLIPYQIEIEMYFVQFDKADIGVLAIERRLNSEELFALWKKGKGELLFAPRVVTQSGIEANVKGVTEVIYPTEVGTGSTQSNTVSKLVELSGFETRETGVILSVLPEKSPDSSMINLTLSPEIVGSPEWREYGETVKTGKEETRRSIIEQPFFHTQSLTTSIGLDNGEMILVGGGMPSRDEGKVVYAFITAQLVDMKGKPIKMKTAVEP